MPPNRDEVRPWVEATMLALTDACTYGQFTVGLSPSIGILQARRLYEVSAAQGYRLAKEELVEMLWIEAEEARGFPFCWRFYACPRVCRFVLFVC